VKLLRFSQAKSSPWLSDEYTANFMFTPFSKKGGDGGEAETGAPEAEIAVLKQEIAVLQKNLAAQSQRSTNVATSWRARLRRLRGAIAQIL